MERNNIGKKERCSFCNEVKSIVAEDVSGDPKNNRYYCAECYEDIRKDRKV
jgi:hypothetical protein